MAEAQIDDRGNVTAGGERRADVLQAQGLDAEKGPRPKRSLPGSGRINRTFIATA